jgi:hypothetical protein
MNLRQLSAWVVMLVLLVRVVTVLAGPGRRSLRAQPEAAGYSTATRRTSIGSA